MISTHGLGSCSPVSDLDLGSFAYIAESFDPGDGVVVPKTQTYSAYVVTTFCPNHKASDPTRKSRDSALRQHRCDLLDPVAAVDQVDHNHARRERRPSAVHAPFVCDFWVAPFP